MSENASSNVSNFHGHIKGLLRGPQSLLSHFTSALLYKVLPFLFNLQNHILFSQLWERAQQLVY